jgi:hypothetical protein
MVHGVCQSVHDWRLMISGDDQTRSAMTLKVAHEGVNPFTGD